MTVLLNASRQVCDRLKEQKEQKEHRINDEVNNREPLSLGATPYPCSYMTALSLPP